MRKATVTYCCDYCGEALLRSEKRLRMHLTGPFEPEYGDELEFELDFCNFNCAAAYVAGWAKDPMIAHKRQRELERLQSSDEHGPDIP